MTSVTHKKIDFVIVGQPKSGTTALAHFLSQHPDVSMSVPKEPAYFATDFQIESDHYHGRKLYFHYRTPDDFDALFKHSKNSDLLGEASTCYLYSKDAAKNIHKHNPAAKIIIMLRNPVEMVHSLHMQYVNETQEDEKDFERALQLEMKRKLGSHNSKRIVAPSYAYYSERIKYTQQIKRFQKYFPENQILVLVFEQFKKDNEAYYKKVLEYINADTNFVPEFSVVHGSKAPKSDKLNRALNVQLPKTLLHKLIGPAYYTKVHNIMANLVMDSAKRPEMNPALRSRLTRNYTNEVRKTEKLLGFPLLEEWGYTDIANK